MIRSYLRSSLWIVPFIAFLTYLVLIRVIDVLDERIDWAAPFLAYGTAGLTAGLQTLITLTMSFLVFTFGSLLVAIQVASGQLTPRIIATTLLRNNAIRASVGLFILSRLSATGALVRLDTGAHLIILVAFLLGLAVLMAIRQYQRAADAQDCILSAEEGYDESLSLHHKDN